MCRWVKAQAAAGYVEFGVFEGVPMVLGVQGEVDFRTAFLRGLVPWLVVLVVIYSVWNRWPK